MCERENDLLNEIQRLRGKCAGLENEVTDPFV